MYGEGGAFAQAAVDADFATHQLLHLDRRVSSEDRSTFLTLENERLELNNQRASEEFSRFRASLLHEIEERRAAERQLAESEELLRLIMSSTVEAIYGTDTHGICTFANESCLKLLGYEHIGEVLGNALAPVGKIDQVAIFVGFVGLAIQFKTRHNCFSSTQD
jgi:PAS domain-containing protein